MAQFDPPFFLEASAIHMERGWEHSTSTKERFFPGKISKFRALDFPGGPMAKTQHSQHKGPGFDPWSGN